MLRDALRSSGKRFAIVALLAFILISGSFAASSAVAISNSSPNTAQGAVASVTTHPIEYIIGCSPSMVDNGSLDYFKSHGFSTVHLIAPDQGTYQAELKKIKSMGMKPVIDVEVVIWNQARYQSTPISNYASYFKSLKAAGWEYVSSEGGRQGDANYLVPQYFKGYINYNCDQCGLWKDVYKETGTVMNSWESFYPQEWSYIQQGAKEAAALGKQNGILAGVWGTGPDGKDYNPILTNSKTGGSPSYQSMLDWSYANGCGFNHFHVWCGTQNLSKYKALGFEQIVAQLQVKYPATGSSQGSTRQVTQLSLKINNAVPTAGQSITFSGILQTRNTSLRLPSQPVYLLVSKDNANWSLVSRTADSTDGSGVYAFNGSRTAGTYYFRTYYDGTAQYKEAFSPSVKVTVGASTTRLPTKLSLAVSNVNPSANQAISSSGILQTSATTSTRLTNQSIYLLVSKDNVNWSLASSATAKTNSNGAYAFSGSLAAGTYYCRTYYDGTAQYKEAFSPTVKVVVK
ncbi:MAG: hypothetical protein ACXV45_07075 [Halobacteriota archaeon]